MNKQYPTMNKVILITILLISALSSKAEFFIQTAQVSGVKYGFNIPSNTWDKQQKIDLWTIEEVPATCMAIKSLNTYFTSRSIPQSELQIQSIALTATHFPEKENRYVYYWRITILDENSSLKKPKKTLGYCVLLSGEVYEEEPSR